MNLLLLLRVFITSTASSKTVVQKSKRSNKNKRHSTPHSTKKMQPQRSGCVFVTF
jgi:hypothetical protein